MLSEAVVRASKVLNATEQADGELYNIVLETWREDYGIAPESV